MKNSILFLFTLLLAASPAFAQNQPYKLSSEQEEKCTELTRFMVRELRLNEVGYIKLKALNRERMALAEAVKIDLKDDLAAQEQKLHQIEADFDRKLSEILDAGQLQAYAIYKRNSPINVIAASKED